MGSEIYGFTFSIVFILLFTGFLVAIPTDLYGEGSDPDVITPLSPSLLTGFESSQNFTGLSGDFVPIGVSYFFEYSLGGYTWLCDYFIGLGFTLGSKILYFGLWLGQLDSCNFIAPDNGNRGGYLSFAEIDEDLDAEGSVIYTLQSIGSGTARGYLVLGYNITTYSDSEDAFDNDELYFLHGIGVSETAPMDAVSLLISLLLLQLPDCPPLINLLLASPIYACVIFLIWFLIKETIPFV